MTDHATSGVQVACPWALGLRSTRGTLGFQPGDSETPLASLLAESKWRYPLDSCDWVAPAGAFSEAPLLVIDEFDMFTVTVYPPSP